MNKYCLLLPLRLLKSQGNYKYFSQNVGWQISYLPLCVTNEKSCNLLQQLPQNALIQRRCKVSVEGRPKLTLYSKSSGCSLCDDAKEVLVQFKDRVEFVEVDIGLAENKDWFKKYCFDIPVIHLNDAFLMKHKVDVTVLENALNSLIKK